MNRPPAVPLVTIDPYFSVWSMADRLTDDDTRHWTGKRNGMTGLIRIDGITRRFMGLVEPSRERYYTEPQALLQQELEITALSTTYTFAGDGIELKVRFTSPLLLDDLDTLSRPASYLSCTVRSIDGRPHDVQIYVDATGEWCVDTTEQEVVGSQQEEGPYTLLSLRNAVQKPLHKSGDDVRIDWGAFYLAVERDASVQSGFAVANTRKRFVHEGIVELSEADREPRAVNNGLPVVACVWHSGVLQGDGDAASRTFVLAYDDDVSLEYFGDRLQGYWKRGGTTAPAMIADAFAQYPELLARCDAFDRMIRQDGERAGGAKYADLLTLTYRQAIAAHKLLEDREGRILFVSKECYSNGCAATVDVSYPSMPLFLLYQPELVKGMMRPIFNFAARPEWKFEFAPHDVGQYPLANGQVYSFDAEGQMPVEECGNMLIMAAAVCAAEKSPSFAEEHWTLLTQWAEYLAVYGLDPENQLCTDDFAGHLARNANLSIKAIMGITSFSLLNELRGNAAEAARYRQLAKDMGAEWIKLADDGDHYQLAFGAPDTWSLKYNLVWDTLFATGIFPQEVARQEVAWYLQKQDRYGTPLDSRKHYTKSDWLIWAASMAEREEDFQSLIEPIWTFANETPDRVPLTDWYDTNTARQMNFQHRSVVGGFYMKVLKEKWASATAESNRF
ncbi:glutaminase family protein [Paenibacillus sp. R14(2021)]|uniref:glutaminase family protein n=1 Tax=Paenibacillus sp. R14(2021) TaxID=2859228 RepID=UPI001C61614F|nr:glutaminase family protein [Paenibacillus sp. R14(2021)]